MALNIKNPRVEQLVEEVAGITGETKTEAILRALAERRDRLAFRVARKSREDIFEFLRREIWSQVPPEMRRKKLSRKEWDRILGYGKNGA